MHSMKSQHRCQIDCTNHDEVINSLQLKSKDLYYFWRNYQWLYNKYYNQQPQKAQQPAISTRQLEQEISKISSQNRRLKIDNQSLRKQIQALSANTSNKRVESQFQRQIDRLNAKCKDYENIREKLTQQITILTTSVRTKQDQLAENQSKYKRQLKRQESTIIQLQKNIDDLRDKLMKNNSNATSQQMMQYQEKISRNTQKTQILIRNLQQKCYQMIESELDQAKTDLLREFPNMISKFAAMDLSNLIIEEEEEDDRHH